MAGLTPFSAWAWRRHSSIRPATCLRPAAESGLRPTLAVLVLVVAAASAELPGQGGGMFLLPPPLSLVLLGMLPNSWPRSYIMEDISPGKIVKPSNLNIRSPSIYHQSFSFLNSPSSLFCWLRPPATVPRKPWSRPPATPTGRFFSPAHPLSSLHIPSDKRPSGRNVVEGEEDEQKELEEGIGNILRG